MDSSRHPLGKPAVEVHHSRAARPGGTEDGGGTEVAVGAREGGDGDEIADQLFDLISDQSCETHDFIRFARRGDVRWPTQ